MKHQFEVISSADWLDHFKKCEQMTTNQKIEFSAPSEEDMDDVMTLFLDVYCKMDPLIKSAVDQGKTHSQVGFKLHWNFFPQTV